MKSPPIQKCFLKDFQNNLSTMIDNQENVCKAEKIQVTLTYNRVDKGMF